MCAIAVCTCMGYEWSILFISIIVEYSIFFKFVWKRYGNTFVSMCLLNVHFFAHKLYYHELKMNAGGYAMRYLVYLSAAMIV